MSRRKSPINDTRFDSATDLLNPYDERRYPSIYPSINRNGHVRKERQTPTIQHRVPKLLPATQADKYIPPYRRTSPPAHDQFDPYTGYNTAIATPCPYLANSIKPTSPISSSSPTSYASVLARSSSATPSTSTASTASIIAESITLCCSQCDAKFTGTYRRGNLARHVRHKHAGATTVLFKCKADGCTSIFNRQDARLKHERQRHPELDSGSIKKESSCSPAPHMTEQAEELSAVPPPMPFALSIDDVPQSVRTFLCRVRARLDNTNYARFRDMFMTLLERLVLYQRDSNSEAYAAYAKVLDNMNVVVDAIDAGSIDIAEQAHQDMADAASYAHSTRPAQAARPSKNRTSTLNPWSKDKSRPDLNSSSAGRKSSSHGKQNNVKVTKRDRGKGSRNRAVDCPDHKHYMMLSAPQTPSPCGGCKVLDMSQVRRHLKLTAHNGRLGAQQCPLCKQEFDSQETFSVHDAARNCQNQAQLRGPIEKPWALLYLARYPEADKIPSPFCDTMDWLPHSIVEECRIWLQNNTPLSFLGEPTYTTGGPYNDPLLSNPTALNEWFRNALNWTVSMGSDLASRFPGVANASTTFNMDVGSSERGLSHRDTRYHIGEIYSNTEQYFGTPAEAPLYVQQEQLRPLADEAAAAARPVENYIQYPSLQHALDGSGESTTGESTTAKIKPPESIYGASQTVTQYWSQHQPMQNKAPQTPHIDYHHAPSISTQSYTPDQYPGSSQYNISPQTGPSSIQEPVDNTHFSPLASPHYTRALQSFNYPDCPVPPIPRSDYLDLPEPYSPPGNPPHTGIPLDLDMDGSLEQHPFSYSDQQGDIAWAGEWDHQ